MTEVEVTDVEVTAEALHDLRKARRRNRLSHVHWIDALYRVYMAGLVAVILVLFLSSRLPDERQSTAEALRFANEAPMWLGLAFAVAVGIGLRSGGRGGPLVLEAPVVVHELNAPVPRSDVVRGPAIKQLRFLAFAGAVVGAIVGELAARRLPVNVVASVVCCAAAFALAGVLASAAAMAVSGRRIRWWPANAIAAVLLAWSALDIVLGVRTSPLSLLADVTMWPITFRPLALVGVAVVGVVAYLGLSRIGELSIEHALRRAGLVAQLRFAVTLQDVRTVVLLRRQLSQEKPRRVPWIRIGRASGTSRVPPAWKRDWQSYLRFPLPRLIRMVILAAAAGVALGLTWRGITPAIILAGLALYLAAYDAAEPIAQEVDHPTRWEEYPDSPGRVLAVGHLPAAFTVMLLVSLIAAAFSLILVPPVVVAELLWMVLFAAGGATIAASISTAQGAPDVAGISGLGPDLMGWVMLARLVIPPVITVACLLPLLGAGSDADLVDPALVANYSSYVLFLLGASFLYLRTRKPKHL